MQDLKVVVLGGRGYLGARVIRALQRASGVIISVAGRQARTVVDIRDPGTYVRLHGADVVINLASSADAPSEALANYCIKQGITLIEASADRAVLDPLPKQLEGVTGPGRVVLGAGIFPGLSNLVARAAVGGVDTANSLRLGICSNLFSGAGRSTIALMAGGITEEAISYREGEPQYHPRMIEGERMPFPTGVHATVLAPMADVGMVQASMKVPDLAVYLAPKPDWVRTMFLRLPGSWRTDERFQKFVFYSLLVMRRFVLALTPTPVEIVAVAKRKTGEVKKITLSTMDGMTAAGAAIAAIALIARERNATLPPISYVDQIMTLPEAVSRLNRIVPPGAEVRIDGVEAAREVLPMAQQG